ncbi:hypothetical protein BDC45DRAFT_553739 [Circinella umbellata]|nr:hypothetical protein BDC45DRAFT_553739 [Circinella umbellata]
MDSISEQSHFIARPTAPVSGVSLSDKDRETAIAALEAAVLDETGINFGLCEKSWAANHLLCEAWNNLMNDARKVYADYQEKLGAEIDGVLDGSSLQEPLETETYNMEEEQDENTDQYLDFTPYEMEQLSMIMECHQTPYVRRPLADLDQV